MIHNNYIDNGRLLINTSSDEMADRNYVHVTDNIFYRGYNHPNNQKFNHIYVSAEDDNSSFVNVIITFAPVPSPKISHSLVPVPPLK